MDGIKAGTTSNCSISKAFDIILQRQGGPYRTKKLSHHHLYGIKDDPFNPDIHIGSSMCFLCPFSHEKELSVKRFFAYQICISIFANALRHFLLPLLE